MPWNRTTVDVNEMDDINIRYYVEKNYEMTNDKKIREGLRIVASENSYHPVRDYFNSLVWDGKERIRYVLHHFLGADINEFTYEFMKLLLLGTICRAFGTGFSEIRIMYPPPPVPVILQPQTWFRYFFRMERISSVAIAGNISS